MPEAFRAFAVSASRFPSDGRFDWSDGSGWFLLRARGRDPGLALGGVAGRGVARSLRVLAE